MKYKISAVLMLSLMLSMLFMPLSASADGGKSIVKEMVQAPADYSVGLDPSPYGLYDLRGRQDLGYYHAYNRIGVYLPDWVFWRLWVGGEEL